MGEFRDIKQVAGDPAHDLTDLGIGIIGAAKPLQMSKRISAHVCFNMNAHDMTMRTHIEIGCSINDAQGEVQQCHISDHRDCKRCRVKHCCIGQSAHDPRKGNITQGGQRCAQKVQGKHTFIFHQIRCKSGEEFFHRIIPADGSAHGQFLHNIRII